MDDTVILTHLKSIHEGGQIDGRTLRSLKRRGYVDSCGLLTAWGFRTLGVYRHIPKMTIVDPTSYSGQRATIIEDIFTECSCCGGRGENSWTETYTVSVEKLAEQYNDYVTLVNDYLAEHCWDHQLDEMVERGWAPQGIQKQMLKLAQDKIWFTDFRYTWHILKDLMLGIIEGKQTTYKSTSYKYSITDTTDEIKNLIDNGPAQYMMNVEVNR